MSTGQKTRYPKSPKLLRAEKKSTPAVENPGGWPVLIGKPPIFAGENSGFQCRWRAGRATCSRSRLRCGGRGQSLVLIGFGGFFWSDLNGSFSVSRL